MWRFGFALLFIGAVVGARPAVARQADSGASNVQMIVTVEAQHGNSVPVLGRQDVVVREGSNHDAVTGLTPLKDSHADMDLFVVLDDGSDSFVALQYNDLKKFITAQPASARVGIAYMRNGMVDIEQKLTADHAAATKAIRVPMGVTGNSPYFSLMDLMKRFPNERERREIVLVSNGIDPGEGLTDPYLQNTIEQAQKDRILIYSIYARGNGYFDHNIGRISLGENMLSKLSGETGAEAFFQGFHTPISFAPFLDEISEQLSHQYLVTFSATAGTKDSLRHVTLETEVPNAQLITADQAFVPAVAPR